jgi:DNA-binding CsgD family transcriptional regulator
MEYVLARRLTVADLCDASHKLQPLLRRALRDRLTPGQARRYELVLAGYSYAEIGAQEGCIKQAVGQSIAKANRKLVGDESFRKLLVSLAERQLPEEFTIERGPHAAS